MSFTAHEEQIMELFSRKVYNIPRNQRRYVWNKDNWQELFDDIKIAVKESTSSHFIGSIVLKADSIENGLRHFSVIDGQQRMITLTIFLSSIMFWMKRLGMEDDFNGTIPYVIAKDDKNKDVVMVTAENNGSLESIIKAIVNLKEEDAGKTSINSIIEANLLNHQDKNLGDAFKFFMSSINGIYESNSKDSRILIKLRNAVRDITFVNITATTEEDSYTIFEILNARGLDLDDHELLKNYIMRYIQPEKSRDVAKTEWNRMESLLGNTNLKKFVRHYTTHRYGDCRSKNYTSDYKIIRDKNKGKDTRELLKDLECKANYYIRLVSPCVNGENANCSKTEYQVYSFFKKKRQEQMRPVLLSLIAKNVEGLLSDRLYENTINYLYNYFVCYNIIGEESSNKLTNILNKYAAKINEEYSETIIRTFINELEKKLPSEDMFMNSFENVGWSHHASIYEGDKNKSRVKTILEVFERHINNGRCCDDFTIEHILPDSEGMMNGQIGNLIPLEEVLNKRCVGKSIAEKMEIYQESQYASARKLSKRYTDKSFDPANRTKHMAKEFYRNILQLHD